MAHLSWHSINMNDLHVKDKTHLLLTFCKALLTSPQTQLSLLFASSYSLIILLFPVPVTGLKNHCISSVPTLNLNITFSKKVLWLTSWAVRHFLRPVVPTSIEGITTVLSLFVSICLHNQTLRPLGAEICSFPFFPFSQKCLKDGSTYWVVNEGYPTFSFSRWKWYLLTEAESHWLRKRTQST